MKPTTLDQLNLRLRSFKYFQRHPVIFRVVSSLTIIDKRCNSGSRTSHYHREWKCSLGPVDHLKWDIRKEKKNDNCRNSNRIRPREKTTNQKKI